MTLAASRRKCHTSQVITIAHLELEARRSQDPERLQELATHKSSLVRCRVSTNPNTTDAMIEQLLADIDGNVRMWAASALAERPALYAYAAESPHRWVRASLATVFSRHDDRSLPYPIQRALADDEFYETRKGVASTTNFADIFDRLLADDDPRVRGWCAANPRIALNQMEQLVGDKSSTVRRLTAALGLRYPSDEQLVRLARDRSKEVRWAVLFRPDRPREAVEIIAMDSDDINRRHAESALVSNGYIMSPMVETSFRTELNRAVAASPFEAPPG